MDYYNWSKEYYGTAESIAKVIDKLKAERRTAPEIGKKELDLKIAKYKVYYGECIRISNLLMERFKRVG